jgi:hypothetical protein
MDLATLQQAVAEVLDGVRDSLGRIEEAAQLDEDERLLHVSRHYAGLIGPLRDYLTGASLGRPTPRQLAQRLTEGRARLTEFEDLIVALSLHPDLQELAVLSQEAQSAV